MQRVFRSIERAVIGRRGILWNRECRRGKGIEGEGARESEREEESERG